MITLAEPHRRLPAQSLPARPRRRVALLVAVAALMLGLLPAGALSAAAAAGAPVTYQDHVYASGAGAASADKPQSKLWYNDGSWWAIMATASTVNIFRLVDRRWVDTGTVVDTRIASTGDALFEDGKLYVASRTASGTDAVRVFRYSYSSATKTYTKDTGFPVKIPGGGSESVTIAREDGTSGTRRVWITFTRGSAVWVAHSTTSDTVWTSPFRIQGADTDVAADDISAVVSMPGRIAVMWSDQGSSAFRFAIHNNADPDTQWAVETPLDGIRMADDHINLKSALSDDGRVLAAIKTSQGDGGEPSSSPSLMVLSRTSSGVWTSAVTATVADNLTRPQLAVDSDSNTLFVLQSTEGGGKVYYKSTPLSAVEFGPGPGAPFMEWAGAKINNVSTTKQPVNATTGLVAIATDASTSTYYHTEMALAATDSIPPTVTAVTPADGAAGVAASATVQATFSEPMDASTVNGTSFTLAGPGTTAVPAMVTYDPTTTKATLVPNSALAPSTTYTAAVSGARDVAGNPMSAPRTWSFTTAATAGTQTVTITPSADSYVKSTTPSRNYGTATVLSVDASPVTTSYLKFNVSPYVGRSVQSASLQVRTTSATGSGSPGPQNVKLVSNDSWTETGLKYSNRPGLGASVGTLGATSVNAAYTIPLAANLVQGALTDPALSVALDTAQTNGVDLLSRQSATPPQLVLVLTAP